MTDTIWVAIIGGTFTLVGTFVAWVLAMISKRYEKNQEQAHTESSELVDTLLKTKAELDKVHERNLYLETLIKKDCTHTESE